MKILFHVICIIFLTFIVSSAHSDSLSNIDLRGVKLGMSYNDLKKLFPDSIITEEEASNDALSSLETIVFSFRFTSPSSKGLHVGLDKDKKVIYAFLSQRELFSTNKPPFDLNSLSADFKKKYGNPDYYGMGSTRNNVPNNDMVSKYHFLWRATWCWGDYFIDSRFNVEEGRGPAKYYFDRGKSMTVYYDIDSYSFKSDNVALLIFKLVDMDLVNKEKAFLKKKTINF